MSQLREEVIIKTATGELRGFLFVGHDHLPELRIPSPATLAKHGIDTGKSGFDDYYRPANIPAAWRLRPMGEDGLLLKTWLAIQELQSDIAQAEREAEADDIARSRWQHDEQVAAEYDRADAEERDQANQQSIDNQVAAGRIVAGGVGQCQ